MRNQKGFTLIELIIVIVVLGILAVTAAPQFFNFSGDARTSTVKGLKGNIQGAYQTVYAKAAVEGKLGDSATLDSGITTAYGYPTADTAGIINATSLSTEDWVIFDSTSTVPGKGTAPTSGTIVISAQDVNNDGKNFSDLSTATGCFVGYTAPTAADTPPTITIKTGECGN